MIWPDRFLVGPNSVIDPPTLAESPVDVSSSGSPIEDATAATDRGTALRENSSVNSNAVSIQFGSPGMNVNAGIYVGPVLFGMREGEAGLAFDLPAHEPGTTAAEVSVSHDPPDLEPSSLFLIGVFLVAGWMYLRRKLD